MAILGRLSRAACLVAVTASLAACVYGSAQPPLAQVHDRSASSMSPAAAAAKSLLYVSDAQAFKVYVYTFPDLKRTGILTGFDRPQGECSDAKGDVWITNNQDFEILRYHHGGTKAVAVLSDPLGFPAGCAIDPRSGDLAVTNLFGVSGGGGVLVFKKAVGTPRPYTNPSQYYYYLDGYDDKGNLYVSGENSNGSYALSVLARGKDSMSSVSVSGAKIFVPGTVQWTGSSLLLGDQHCDNAKTSCLYEAVVSGTKARITQKVALAGSCDVVQIAFEKGRIAGGDYWRCGGGRRSSTDIWAYPRGGRPIKAVTGIQAPIGATISNRPDL